MRSFQPTYSEQFPFEGGVLKQLAKLLQRSGAGYAALLSETNPKSPTAFGYGLYL